jgi:zinc D-Ala-D-Ala carboxypeptidase
MSFFFHHKYQFILKTLLPALVFALLGLIIYVGGTSNGITTDLTASFSKEQNQASLIPINNPMETSKSNLPDKAILLGKLSGVQQDSMLMAVGRGYGNRDGLLMHKEAFQAFVRMHAEAKQQGVELTIISAFRNFEHQKRIWENKWNGRQILSGNKKATDISNPVERSLEILRFSSMPGTSRHHWGTDIDINSLNNSYFNTGRGKREYQWLIENANRFGFYQPYTHRNLRNNRGYEEEKWHWSYLPIAATYLDAYQQLVRYSDLTGFDGCHTASEIDIINHYVLAIDQLCLDFKETIITQP